MDKKIVKHFKRVFCVSSLIIGCPIHLVSVLWAESDGKEDKVNSHLTVPVQQAHPVASAHIVLPKPLIKTAAKIVSTTVAEAVPNEVQSELEQLRKQVKQLQESIERLASKIAKNKPSVPSLSANHANSAVPTATTIITPAIAVKETKKAVALHPAESSTSANSYSIVQLGQLGQWYDSIWSEKTEEAQKSSKEMIEFAKQHPQDLWSDNLIFWAGDFYYRRKNWDSAIAAFQILLDQFPNSHQIPEVLYRLGVVYYQNQDKGNADKVLMRLLDMYPMNRFRMKVKKLMESHQ